MFLGVLQIPLGRVFSCISLGSSGQTNLRSR